MKLLKRLSIFIITSVLTIALYFAFGMERVNAAVNYDDLATVSVGSNFVVNVAIEQTGGYGFTKYTIEYQTLEDGDVTATYNVSGNPTLLNFNVSVEPKMIFNTIRIKTYYNNTWNHTYKFDVASIIYKQRNLNTELCNDLILYGYFCYNYFGVAGSGVDNIGAGDYNWVGLIEDPTLDDSLNVEYQTIMNLETNDLGDKTNNVFFPYRIQTVNYKTNNLNSDDVAIAAYNFSCSSTCTLYVYLSNKNNDWTNYTVTKSGSAYTNTFVDSNNRLCIVMQFGFKELTSDYTYEIQLNNNTVYKVKAYGLSYAYTIARKYNGEASYKNLVNIIYCMYRLGYYAATAN